MTTLDRDPSSAMTGAADSAGGPRPAASTGKRTLATAGLGVAILVAAGLSIGVLATGTPGTSGAPSAAPAPAAAAGPASAPAAAPAPVPSPAANPAAGSVAGPALIDTAGAPLPSTAATGVQTVTTNLTSGDVDALQAAYVPGPRVPAAPWPVVANLLTDPANRAGLLAALRTAPSPTPDGWEYTAPNNDKVGVDRLGHVSYVRLS